jgi:hypothetical protein
MRLGLELPPHVIGVPDPRLLEMALPAVRLHFRMCPTCKDWAHDHQVVDPFQWLWIIDDVEI